MNWPGLITAVIGLLMWYLKRRADATYITRRAQAALDINEEAQRRTRETGEAIADRDVDRIVDRIDSVLRDLDALNRMRSTKEGDSH